jgi:hypothetical protein
LAVIWAGEAIGLSLFLSDNSNLAGEGDRLRN